MADVVDIEQVRRNTAETLPSEYTDEVLGAYIDLLGVSGASVKVWEEKAAEAAELVDVSEAGASHKFSDLRKHAEAMATYWRTVVSGEVVVETSTDRVRVRKIERS